MKLLIGTCENCGSSEVTLTLVRRVYIVPESWDSVGSETVMDEIEEWCNSCTSNYPFVPVEADQV